MSASPPGSAPVARIRLDALARNARDLHTPGAVADLRADACGHDAIACAATLARAGFDAVVVDGAQRDRVAAAVPGLRLADDATVPAAALLGLDGTTRPVLRLTGAVLGVKELRAGEGVSYGYRFRAPADTRIALVTGGYAQGVVRALGDRATVVIAGRRHPIVGRVAMDVCVVAVGDAEVDRAAEVVFLGDPERGEPVVAEWSGHTGMRATELVAAVGARARRVAA